MEIFFERIFFCGNMVLRVGYKSAKTTNKFPQNFVLKQQVPEIDRPTIVPKFSKVLQINHDQTMNTHVMNRRQTDSCEADSYVIISFVYTLSKTFTYLITVVIIMIIFMSVSMLQPLLDLYKSLICCLIQFNIELNCQKYIYIYIKIASWKIFYAIHVYVVYGYRNSLKNG